MQYSDDPFAAVMLPTTRLSATLIWAVAAPSAHSAS